MEKLLFANVDVNGTDQQSWCRYEPTLGKGKIDTKTTSKGSQYDCYHTLSLASDDTYTFAYNHELDALVLTEKGTMRSSGFVMVVSGGELFVDRYAAGYIGSTKPGWIPTGGTIFESDMESNLSDISWLQYLVPKKVNSKFIREKIVPLVFLLLNIKRDSGKKKLVCICKSSSELNEMEGLLKRALMALPLQLSNQYSFNTNATADQLKISDVSCITEKAFEKESNIDEGNLVTVKYPFGQLDAEQLSESSFCQYLFEDGIIPKDIDPNICTVEELERSVSDIRLENYCKNRISCEDEEVAKAFRFYDAAHEEYIATSTIIPAAFTQLAYDVYFSKYYSQVNTGLLARLRRFISQESNNVDVSMILDSDELLTQLLQEEEGAINHLYDLYAFLSGESGISDKLRKSILNLMYGKVKDINCLLPLLTKVVERMNFQEFTAFLKLSKAPDIDEWKNIIVNKVIKFDTANNGLNAYLSVRGADPISWLFESIVAKMKIQSFVDIGAWVEFKGKLDNKLHTKEHSILNAQFASTFEGFLDTIEFYKPANQVLVNIENNSLELIFSAAEKFDYSAKRFVSQRNKIIQLTKRENAIETLRSRALIPLRGKKQVNTSEKLVQKAKLNHFVTNTPGLLFIFLLIQMVALISAFYLTANLAVWDILSAITQTISAEKIRILFIGIPLALCLGVYIGVIAYGQQYEARLVAIRAFSISNLTIILPIVVFLLTTGIMFH